MYIPITKNFTIKVCGRKKSPLLLYFTINQMLFYWLKLGRKVDRKRLRIHSNIVGCFCFAENRGMLPSIELLVFLLNELDVIVFVINRRLLVEIES